MEIATAESLYGIIFERGKTGHCVAGKKIRREMERRCEGGGRRVGIQVHASGHREGQCGTKWSKGTWYHIG